MKMCFLHHIHSLPESHHSIDEITDDELIQINWYLNCRPLKCLNWRTPIEIFLRNLRY